MVESWKSLIIGMIIGAIITVLVQELLKRLITKIDKWWYKRKNPDPPFIGRVEGIEKKKTR